MNNIFVTVLSNNFIIYNLIYFVIIVFFYEITTIEFRYIKNIILENIKHIVGVFVLANIIKLQEINSIITIINIIYDSYIYIIILLLIFYIIDIKLSDRRIIKNYFKYGVYSSYIFLCISFILNKNIEITILAMAILLLMNLYYYKIDIYNKYDHKDIINIYDFIGFILINIVLKNNILNYEVWVIFSIFIFNIIYLAFLYKARGTIKAKEINYIYKYKELSDEPINSKDRLFPTRKKELEYILNYFKENNIDEPFSISISGKWGEGKSSLVNVLKMELESQYIIIDIQPMVTDTREGIIKYFFSSLKNLFIYYDLNTCGKSSIDDYFKSIIKIVDNKDFISIKDKVENDSLSEFDLRNEKEKLQEDIIKLINESGKKILVVVDDFDRVDDEVRYSILTFIKEIINFNGIKSLILLDYTILDNENKINYKYLEKFINKRFNLSRLTTEEIWENYNNLMDKEINYDDRNKLDKELDYLDRNSYKEIKKLQDRIKKCIEELDHEKKDDRSEQIKSLEKLELSINTGIENPRTVKQIIREIRDRVDYIKYIFKSFTIEEKNELVNNLNIKDIVITMVLIKILYEDDFDKILESKNFAYYIEHESKEKTDKGIHNEINSEVKELIYCNMIKDKYRINTSYKIYDRQYIYEFINNVYISINTFDDMSKYRTKKQNLLKIISQENIDFNNDKNVFENIMSVYNDIENDKIQQYMVNISKYLSYKLADGKIDLDSVVQLIRPDNNYKSVIKYNKKYIKKLSEYLEGKVIIYDDISRREYDKEFLDRSIMEIIKLNVHNIAFIISYKTQKMTIDEYHDIIRNLSKDILYSNINEINKKIKGYFVDYEISLMDIDSFLKCEGIDDIEIYNRIKRELNEMIDMINDLQIIKKYVEESKLKKFDYENKDYVNMRYEELIDCLEKFRDDLRKDIDNYDNFFEIVDNIKMIVLTLEDKHKEGKIQENIDLLRQILSIALEKNKYTYKNYYYDEINMILNVIQLKII